MRKITPFFILFLVSLNSLFGQIENFYSVSQETRLYQPLKGADETVLRSFTFYNEQIPFEFEYAGRELGFLIFHSTGELGLSGSSITPQPNDIADIGQQKNGVTSIIGTFMGWFFKSS